MASFELKMLFAVKAVLSCRTCRLSLTHAGLRTAEPVRYLTHYKPPDRATAVHAGYSQESWFIVQIKHHLLQRILN